MARFLEKVGGLQLRGTSSLFRTPFSIRDKLGELYSKVQSETICDPTPSAPSKFNFTPKFDVDVQCDLLNTYEVLASNVAPDYVLSKHTMQITSVGNVLELVSNIPDGVSRSQSIASCSRSPEVLRETSEFVNVAKEVLRGLDYFRKPYIENGSKKACFHWAKVKMPDVAEAALKLCHAAYVRFSEDRRCLQLDDPIYILGDLHGNMRDLYEFEDRLWPLGPQFCPSKILFLGDYVDRGEFGVEVILYLFAQKVISPDRVFLIRGNHEIRYVQKEFSFHRECLNKFGPSQGEHVFDAINTCFDVLPFAAIVNQKVFCVHGGIPPSSYLKPYKNVCDAVNAIPCPIGFDGSGNLLAWELMWNDPVWEDEDVNLDANGFGYNKKRQTAHVFSSFALNKFLNDNKLSHVVRAHQAQSGGFQIRYNSKLLTVFSSSSYCDMNNNAACVLLERGKMRLIQIGRDVANGKIELERMEQ